LRRRGRHQWGAARVALSLCGKRRGQGRKTRWFRHAVRKTESWSSWAVQFWVRPHTTPTGDRRRHLPPLDMASLLCWRIGGRVPSLHATAGNCHRVMSKIVFLLDNDNISFFFLNGPDRSLLIILKDDQFLSSDSIG
jgi:hypothetical protein